MLYERSRTAWKKIEEHFNDFRGCSRGCSNKKVIVNNITVKQLLWNPFLEGCISKQTGVWFFAKKKLWESYFNPFDVTGLFLYPQKASGNQRFSNVFRGYRKRPVAWNGLISRTNVLEISTKFPGKNSRLGSLKVKGLSYWILCIIPQQPLFRTLQSDWNRSVFRETTDYWGSLHKMRHPTW